MAMHPDSDHWLASCGHVIPLVFPFSNPELAAVLRGTRSGRDLFPAAPAADAALAGLWLAAGDFERAHSIAQDLKTTEGSYWHAILHRMEPDPGNARYWFQRLGRHPVFPALAQLTGLASWDPFGFIDQCERARRSPGSADEQRVKRIAAAEWELLFSYCAGREPRVVSQASVDAGDPV